jgi:O-antigen/teichoic acid export membrane protein
VLKNVGSNWIVTLLTVAVTYLLTPYVLHTVGVEAYGTWALITSLTGYLGLLALGVPLASVRYLAQHVAESDLGNTNRAIGSCLALYLLLGAAALLVGGALFVFFALTYHVPPVLRLDAHVAFAVAVLYVSLWFVALLPEGVFAAHDDFVVRNVVRVAGVLLRLGLTLGLLALRAKLVMLALVQLACIVFDFSVCWLIIRRRYPGTRLAFADFDWSMVRRIFSFSLYVLLLQAGMRLSFETDSLVIGAFRDVGSIPYFTVGNSFIIYLMEFIVAIAAVVMPTATRLKTQGRAAELRETFLKWSKIALSLTLMVGMFLIVLGPRFIAWWIDPSFEGPAGQVLQILMLSYMVFLPVRGVALPILMGLGKPGLPALGFLVAGVVNLGLSVWLVHPLGLAGVALGTAIPNALFAVLVLVQACRELDTPLSDYLRYVVPRAVLGAFPALALLLWFKVGVDVRSLGGIATAGMAMALLFGVTWVYFVYRNDPYVDLRGRLAGLRAWSRT